jgi:hypothetical protein
LRVGIARIVDRQAIARLTGVKLQDDATVVVVVVD